MHWSDLLDHGFAILLGLAVLLWNIREVVSTSQPGISHKAFRTVLILIGLGIILIPVQNVLSHYQPDSIFLLWK